MDFISGIYHIDVDVKRTQEFYAKEFDLGCECEDCKNFIPAIRQLPDDVKAFFTQFGVDPAKPAEICAYDGADSTGVLYNGFYHICGTILSGKNPWVQVKKDLYHLNEAYAIRFSNGFSFYFTEECMLVDEDFPAPVIQLEFSGYLPWVIDIPNPYI